MPFKEEYGTQTPIALLRQYQDYRCWYDRSDPSLKKSIWDVQFVAAMNPTSGSFTINPRLQRHFAVLGMSMPSESDLRLIFTSVVEGHLSVFSESIRKEVGHLVQGVIEMHQTVASKFLPSAVKFHYNFNMRELVNVFQGLVAMSAEFYDKPRQLVRLYYHECSRVFGDRLTTTLETNRFTKMLIDCTKKNFEEHSSEEDLRLPITFTSFVEQTGDGEPARIRAYASYDADSIDTNADGFQQIGSGYFAILIDQGQDMTPYQGITPIAGASLSSCAEAYFAQSEQIPTRFSLAFGYSQEADGNSGWRAGGVMLQHMPLAGSHVTIKEPMGEDGLMSASDLLDGDASENWDRVNILLDTVDQLELVGPLIEPTQLLLRLFHEEQPRIYDIQPVTFGCTCSDDRVRQSLSIYSAKDIRHMTTDANQVTADCQFCGAHYTFDPDTLGFEAKMPVENDTAAS